MLRKPRRWGLSIDQLDEDDGGGVTKREKVAHLIVEKLLAAYPVVLRESLKRVWPEVSQNRIDASKSIGIDNDIEIQGKGLSTKLHHLAERLTAKKPDICPACGECCKPARWEERLINGAARPLRSRRGLVRRV